MTNHLLPITSNQSPIAMVVLRLVLALVIAQACGATALAQSTALNYSGRISVNGAPFNGTGFFAFSIQETNGVIWWRSGELPYEGSTNLPPRVLKLPVKDG